MLIMAHSSAALFGAPLAARRAGALILLGSYFFPSPDYHASLYEWSRCSPYAFACLHKWHGTSLSNRLSLRTGEIPFQFLLDAMRLAQQARALILLGSYFLLSPNNHASLYDWSRSYPPPALPSALVCTLAGAQFHTSEVEKSGGGCLQHSGTSNMAASITI